ncbi:hypothetical protein D3C75_1029620 [compost metagenome]
MQNPVSCAYHIQISTRWNPLINVNGAGSRAEICTAAANVVASDGNAITGSVPLQSNIIVCAYGEPEIGGDTG